MTPAYIIVVAYRTFPVHIIPINGQEANSLFLFQRRRKEALPCKVSVTQSIKNSPDYITDLLQPRISYLNFPA